jgi:hypothetical protein
MSDIRIKSIYNATDFLEINPVKYHDMWINTLHADRNDMDSFKVGNSVRVYSFFGNPLFADLYSNLASVITRQNEFNDFDVLAGPVPAKHTMEKIELIDYYGDQSALTLFKDESGHIILQTRNVSFDGTEYEERNSGPSIVLCGPINENSAASLKLRSEHFHEMFDHVAKIYPRFNQPKPEPRIRY